MIDNFHWPPIELLYPNNAGPFQGANNSSRTYPLYRKAKTLLAFQVLFGNIKASTKSTQLLNAEIDIQLTDKSILVCYRNISEFHVSN